VSAGNKGRPPRLSAAPPIQLGDRGYIKTEGTRKLARAMDWMDATEIFGRTCLFIVV